MHIHFLQKEIKHLYGAATHAAKKQALNDLETNLNTDCRFDPLMSAKKRVSKVVKRSHTRLIMCKTRTLRKGK